MSDTDVNGSGRHRAGPLDLSETRRRLDDLITFAAEVHDAATAARDAMDANEPFIVPEPVDLSARLAPYTAGTEDVPEDTFLACCHALALAPLDRVKHYLSSLRTAITLRDDGVSPIHEQSLIEELDIGLCELVAGNWPQQVKP